MNPSTPPSFLIAPDPRLQPYLATTDPIPETLTPLLAAHLSSLRDSIHTAEEQARALRRQWEQVEAQRDALIYEKRRWASIADPPYLPTEIVANIFRCTLKAVADDQDSRRPCDTDPFQMSDLRRVCRRWNDVALATPDLWRGVQIDLDRWNPNVGTFSLWHFAKEWTNRGGADCRERRLVMLGLRERDTIRLGAAFASLLVCVEFAAILTDPHITWTQWHLESPLLSTLSSQWGPGGLLGVVMQFAPGAEYGSEEWNAVRGQLTHMSLLGTWTAFELFVHPVESAHFVNLQSLLLSHNAQSLPTPVEIPAYFPTNLRFLHIDGSWICPWDRIFGLSNLEEVILESHNGLCGFRPESQGLLVNTTLRRLVLIGPNIVAQLPGILQHVTLPSLALIRICDVGYERLREWERTPVDVIGAFLNRSKLMSVDLSLEHVGTRHPDLFKNLLHLFRSVKIRHLFLEDVDAFLSRTTFEDQEVEAIVCRNLPTWDYRRPSGGSSKKLRIFLPRPEGNLPTRITDAFNLHYLSPHDTNRMFGHGIQGHQYKVILHRLIGLSASSM
ncbi:hypothetical protein BKA70DRAFT_790133 [Coprinopsis sp. MPI-PUGE-AT-0042]|nr:hypothetical protein BKA70DRAFT_790133 [Coprinopsis sp. MPI-PUGE-AT-0042]